MGRIMPEIMGIVGVIYGLAGAWHLTEAFRQHDQPEGKPVPVWHGPALGVVWFAGAAIGVLGGIALWGVIQKAFL